MKISIDARGVNLYKGSGIGTYIENLLRELLNIDKKNTYSIFWAGENYNEFKKDFTKIIITQVLLKIIILIYIMFHKME